MRRTVLLSLLLLCVALSGPSHDVRFVLPVRTIALSGPRGIDLQYQCWVKRHEQNRWFQVEVWDGDLKLKSDGWDIDGDAAQIQPAYKPLHVWLGPGRFTFRALACSASHNGECTKVRASAVQEILVCGGTDEC